MKALPTRFTKGNNKNSFASVRRYSPNVNNALIDCSCHGHLYEAADIYENGEINTVLNQFHALADHDFISGV